MRPRHLIISVKAKKHLTVDNNITLKSQITNVDQTKMKNLLCSLQLYFLLPEPPPHHTTTHAATQVTKFIYGACKHVEATMSMVSQFQGFFFMICPFSQFGFQIIDGLDFFWDVNNLICYGFFCILVSWAVEKRWLHNKDSGMDGAPEANADLWTGFFHLCHHFCWFLLET